MNNNLNYTNILLKDKILQHNLIKNIYKKCNKYSNSIFNNYDKTEYDIIYAIGDIHGDYETLLQLLEFIKCIIYKKEGNKNKIHWNPKCKNTCLIQTGDILDGYRKGVLIKREFESKDLKIIKLLLRLSEECIQYNSRIILIYGNHEISAFYRLIDNIKLKNYNYTILNPTIENIKLYNNKLKKLQEQIMCNYHTICIVNDYIFCHSGFVLKIILNLLNIFKIKKENFLNLQTSDKLFLINICALGLLEYILSGKVDKIFTKQLQNILIKVFNNREYQDIINDVNELSAANKIKLLTNINESNIILNTKGMVIGHNVIIDYKINNFNNLWGIDVKLSEGFGKDIINETFQILKIKKGENPEIVNIPNKNF